MKFIFPIMILQMAVFSSLYSCAQTTSHAPDETIADRKNVFVDSDPPPNSKSIDYLPYPDEEQFAKTKDGWIDIRLLEVQYYGAPGHPLSAGYVERTANGTTFYRWKDVQIPPDKAPFTGPFHNTRVMEEKAKLKIVDIEPPIQFLIEGHSGIVLPGYFDSVNKYFYTFSRVAVPLSAVPPRSSQHRSPIVRAVDAQNSVAKIIIPIPDHLKKLLAPWTQAPPTSQPATAPASQPAK